MRKYSGLALMGFSGIFIPMIFMYAYSPLMNYLHEGGPDYGMDYLVPRLGGAFVTLVICILLAVKGLRIILRED